MLMKGAIGAGSLARNGPSQGVARHLDRTVRHASCHAAKLPATMFRIFYEPYIIWKHASPEGAAQMNAYIRAFHHALLVVPVFSHGGVKAR